MFKLFHACFSLVALLEQLTIWFCHKEKDTIVIYLAEDNYNQYLKPLINLARIVALENLTVEMTTGKIYRLAHVHERAT
jgi:hypothetical protein